MTELTLEMLRAELAPIKADIIELRHDMVRLEAKIDSKPSSMAMFIGILVLVFGMAVVAAMTCEDTLGFIR